MDKDKIISLSQKAFGICIVAMGIQQLAYGNISPNFVPLDYSPNIIYRALAYPWGIVFTLTGFAYLLNKKVYEVALISGGVFLTLFLLGYLPFLLFFSDKGRVFMQWAPSMQTLSFTGASFIMAASCRREGSHSNVAVKFLEKLMPYGGFFFSVMLIDYGLLHFVYIQGVSTMVPSWMPFHYFWTYLTGTALIGAGLAIIFKFKLKLVATLLGLMIFLWLLMLHIPRAIADPLVMGGLELTRVFVTIGFTGISFLLAYSEKEK
ncbi:MAG TPA: hypothetical protein VL728_08825 [Cyclobacteriaceae bacterium]|jgi:hypothetical protein|nr:hypothetical protein [Cyclobacteriaceae bacterium]